MLIKCNEIDIYINRSENTKGGYLPHSIPSPMLARTLKRNSSRRLKSLLERLGASPPTAPSVVTVCDRN